MRKAKNPELVPRRLTKKGTPARKMGAPEFQYTEEIGNEICEILATTCIRPKKIKEHYPHLPSDDVIFKWALKNPHFAGQYELARQKQQDMFIEQKNELMEQAAQQTYVDERGNARIDPAAVALAKLRCDQINWDAARRARKKWGDKLELHNGESEKVKKELVTSYKKAKSERPF